MSKQKAPKGTASADSEITDSRFSNFTTDPRFRLPSKKSTRTKVDKRFSRMLKDEDFTNTASVDRYGRKLSKGGKKKALERLYVPEEAEEEEEEEGGEGQDDGGKVEGKTAIEVEEDDVVENELRKYDAARGGGFSSSSEDDDDEEEDEGGVEIEGEVEEFPDMQAEQAGVEMGEVSSRIAVVNLDWDNVRSVDLMAVFNSFVRPGGRIHKVSIYQSEFGKERMEREEMEGPPKEIFARKQNEDDEEEEEDSEDSEDDEEEDEKIKKSLLQEDEGKEFDSAALRQYQLERLRYYYAVIICSDNETAHAIYEATDGTEYLSSANFFDLRFIPDGTEFEDRPRDECDAVPSGYRPTEFVTDALQHSKVKLTWDMAPEEASRKDAINRAFSGSRAEIGENDLRAYLGSDSESEEEVEEAEKDVPKLTKKELARQKMRAALGLSDEPTASKKKTAGPVGDMEITFTSGLSEKGKGNVFENEPIKEESTAQAYVRKERERKARRKEKAKAIREGRDPHAEPASDAEMEAEKDADDLGFNDPFFAVDEAIKDKASKSLRKEEHRKRGEAKAAAAAEKESHRAELELLMQDNSTETAPHLEHFDINEIARVEKNRKKKGKSKKKEVEGGKRGGLQESFEMDVGDERFKSVFESHEFAIDPSNPRFKGTEGMKKLVEEGRRKRGVEDVDEVPAMPVWGREKKRKADDASEQKTGELSGLVEKVKKKAKRSLD